MGEGEKRDNLKRGKPEDTIYLGMFVRGGERGRKREVLDWIGRKKGLAIRRIKRMTRKSKNSDLLNERRGGKKEKI